MIKLTRTNGEKVYVSPEKIGTIEKTRLNYSAEGTQVSFHGEMVIVKESPEKVALMVLEYKLAMVRYKSSASASSLNSKQSQWGQEYEEKSELIRLLELEETT